MASNPPPSGPGQPWPTNPNDTPGTGYQTGNAPQPGQWPPPPPPPPPPPAQPTQWGTPTTGQWPPQPQGAQPPPAAQPQAQWGQQPQGQWGQQPQGQWGQQPQQGQWPPAPPAAQPQGQWGQQPQQGQWGQQLPNQWAPEGASGWADLDPAGDVMDYPVDVRFTPEARIGRYWGIPLIGYWVRAIALIPHFIVLAFLGIAAMLMTLFTWIPVLLTGRYPGWGYAVVGGYLRWGVRVGSWLYLLSGTYPTFSGSESEGQHVRVPIDEDRPVGRFWGIPILGIAIRAIILIPHFLVLWLLGILAAFLIWFAWLPVLINGRQAEIVYTIVGGYLRWLTRVGAYLLLLSGPYPPFRLD